MTRHLFNAAKSVCKHVVSGSHYSFELETDCNRKNFTISEMPVVSSSYWNMVHGNKPEEVLQDEEGLQIMRNLGRNMAWILKCIDAGKQKGIVCPQNEYTHKTNFIR